MVVFTPILNIPEHLLISKGIRNVVKYNMSSLHAGLPTLFNLVPTFAEMANTPLYEFDNPTFDMAYHKFILDNDASFNEFMSIMIPANLNPDCLVQVLIKQSDFRDTITESLLKLIQQRYGYNCYIINEVEDFVYAEESDFSIPGLFLFEQDRGRWLMMNSSAGDYNE